MRKCALKQGIQNGAGNVLRVLNICFLNWHYWWLHFLVCYEFFCFEFNFLSRKCMYVFQNLKDLSSFPRENSVNLPCPPSAQCSLGWSLFLLTLSLHIQAKAHVDPRWSSLLNLVFFTQLGNLSISVCKELVLLLCDSILLYGRSIIYLTGPSGRTWVVFRLLLHWLIRTISHFGDVQMGL